jgi:type I restriction enzyme S subunit
MIKIPNNNIANNMKLPNGWKWVKLGDVCSQDKNIIDASSGLGRSLPYLSLEHIESVSGEILKDLIGQIDSEGISTTYTFDDSHVLYSKLRPYLNKVAMPDFAGRCTTELIPFLPDTAIITKDYLAWIFRREETVNVAMSGVTGSRMPRANLKELGRMLIPLPPLPEQKRIVEKLNKQLELAEKAKKAALEKLEAINKLRASLLQKAFEGDGK